MKRAGVLFTGGKDSVYALHKAVSSGLNVVVLLTIVPHYKYSMLYHQPYFEVLRAQAQSLNIPLESAGVYDPEKEVEYLDYLVGRALKMYNIKVLVSGAIKSRFQRRVFESVAEKWGLELYVPHWGLDDYEYMKALLDYGIEFITISITAMGIPHSILGRKFTKEDLELLSKLSTKYGFNLSFEGGEAETLVVDAPLFRYTIEVEGDVIRVSEFESYFQVKKYKLVKKKPCYGGAPVLV